MKFILVGLFLVLMATFYSFIFLKLRNKEGGWLLSRQKFGAVLGAIGSIIGLIMLICHACKS